MKQYEGKKKNNGQTGGVKSGNSNFFSGKSARNMINVLGLDENQKKIIECNKEI